MKPRGGGLCLAWALWLWAVGCPGVGRAQDNVLTVRWRPVPRALPAAPSVVLDQDDDDDDGRADYAQEAGMAAHDLLSVSLQDLSRAELRLQGAARFVSGGRVRPSPVRWRRGDRLFIQGLPGQGGRARLEVVARGASLEVPISVVAVTFLDARGRTLEPAVHAVGVSHHITHDRSLPRDAEVAASVDLENLRVEVGDPQGARGETLTLEALGDDGRVRRALRHVPLRATPSGARRSPFIRLVGDRTDLSAPEVGRQLLQVRLRDRVRALYDTGGAQLHQDIRVGRPGREGGARAALRGRLRLRVLRIRPGGAAVLGRNDAEALQLAREQVEVANEIWLQCFIDFGDPGAADVAIVDPPPPALLAIADGDGLPAAGDGELWFRAADRVLGPIPTRRGARPEQTALAVARALRAAGFAARVSVNPRTQFGADRSADVIVRDKRGALVPLAPVEGRKLSSDGRQRAKVGRVTLDDGVQEFDNMTAAAGTLEERTLIKLLADRDPATVDVFFINRFVSPSRQGEAFIEWDGGAIVNTLVLDRNGVRFQRQAWVQAHELGHVLLDEPFHPDAVGRDRPWLLMDADARQGRVTGPKRLTSEECARVRERSGPGATPALLAPVP